MNKLVNIIGKVFGVGAGAGVIFGCATNGNVPENDFWTFQAGEEIYSFESLENRSDFYDFVEGLRSAGLDNRKIPMNWGDYLKGAANGDNKITNPELSEFIARYNKLQ